MGCDVDSIIINKRTVTYFNPRTHRGVRLEALYQMALKKIFQSTHPSWGATNHVYPPINCSINFNPRTHRGVRLNRLFGLTARVVFQSTHPSWGATRWGVVRQVLHVYFNPRTHRGVRLYGNEDRHRFMQYFNPRTHRGVRHHQSLKQ
mgnify:CR=1 FL=1